MLLVPHSLYFLCLIHLFSELFLVFKVLDNVALKLLHTSFGLKYSVMPNLLEFLNSVLSLVHSKLGKHELVGNLVIVLW